ncbi:MAG: 3-isopropylmalate dehydratase large subunit [Candidatus Bathyarchaeia archaeon]
MNIAEKILARAAGRKEVNPGEFIEAHVDVAMVNDITGPLAIDAFRKIGHQTVWDRERVVIVLDHQTPADSKDSAKLHSISRSFAREQGIVNFYDAGNGGICHQVMVDNGHVVPGDLIVGADSHTCTYGALGAFATGIGSTDMGAVLSSGELWLKVPESIRVEIEGELQRFVGPKDVILYVVGWLGADGAIYKAIEFSGQAIQNMSVSGRMTVCNMAIEMGAKTGIIEPDRKTIDFCRKRTSKPLVPVLSDDDAEYEGVMKLDAEGLEPQVACPSSVDNVKPVTEAVGTEIDQAFLGSCTNGRLEDLRIASLLLRGRKIHKGVRLIVIPASQRVYADALREGLIEVLVRSGAVVCNPTCGPCFGGHAGILADNEICVSSSNRNFVGRMGSRKAKVYLASPATVIASAIHGRIVDPRDYA